MTSTAVAPRVIARPDSRQLRLYAVTSDSSFSIPAGFAISAIYLEETAGNAVTGGINIGVTDGGSTIVNAFAVGASAIKHIAEASLLLRWWSRTVAQTIYLTAASAWNSASLNVTIVLDKVSP